MVINHLLNGMILQVNGRKWMGNWFYNPMGVWSLSVFVVAFQTLQAFFVQTLQAFFVQI